MEFLFPFFAQDHYYAQWFSFPDEHLAPGNSPILWQNVWRNDGDAAHAQTLVTQDMDDMMTAYEYLAGVFNTVLKVGVGACGGGRK